MKFDYYKMKTGDPKREWLIYPLIPIRLSAKGRTIQLLALIDSGADVSLFHSSIAAKLGLDTDIGQTMRYNGIEGQSITGQLYTVDLQVVGANERMTMNVGFTDSSGVHAILGQQDFFEHYQITFERYNERLELKPAKK